MVNNLIERLSIQWPFVTSALIGGIGVGIALLAYYANKGGKRRFLDWFVEIEVEGRNDALSRIRRGLDGVQAKTGTHEACEELVAGLDQWRAVQDRIKKNKNRVRRALLPLYAYFGFAVGAIAVHMFEEANHTFSFVLILCAASSAVLVLRDVAPLSHLISGHGAPRERTEPSIPAAQHARKS